MATRSFMVYLLVSFSVAVLGAHFYFDRPSDGSEIDFIFFSLRNGPEVGETTKVWPELKFSWRIVLATIIGFSGVRIRNGGWCWRWRHIRADADAAAWI
ncbi:unnamed protein product [Rhodiola kirilowii]